jgi:hypothetical protein
MMRSARLSVVAMSVLTLLAVSAPAAAAEDASAPIAVNGQRPAALVPLYASFLALQVADLHSTWRALDHGAVEANPLLENFAGSRPVLLTVKAAGSVGVIAASEALSKKSRTAAIIFMIGANSAMTWVVQHNYGAVR